MTNHDKNAKTSLNESVDALGKELGLSTPDVGDMQQTFNTMIKDAAAVVTPASTAPTIFHNIPTTQMSHEEAVASPIGKAFLEFASKLGGRVPELSTMASVASEHGVDAKTVTQDIASSMMDEVKALKLAIKKSTH